MESMIVPTIHCPSCVYAIQSALKNSAAKNVSVNLLNKSVSFECDDKNAAKREVVGALHEIGYSVDQENSFLRSKDKGKSHETLNTRHLESCQECREKGENATKTGKLFYFTKLSVEGMTCASCTQTLSSTLRGMTGVDPDSVRVSLMSAEAEFIHEQLSLESVQNEIDTIGYESKIIESSPLKKEEDQDTVITKFEFKGMTCASCSQTISSALKLEEGVLTVDVSLTSATAIVEHNKAVDVAHLVDTIEDIGYGATAVSTVSRNEARSNERNVEFKVDGMFCGHCPSHLLDTLNSLPLIAHTNDITLDHPFVTVTYTPNSPLLTVRSIIRDIHHAHPKFTITAVENNSANSSRSTAIHLAESKAWLVRVAVSAVFSFAALVINVIGMELLNEDHPVRRELERPIWGQATVGIVVMFLLSSPVYLIVGWNFHKKSYLSLKASYKAVSKSDRFPWIALVTWGSMDLLVSLGTTVAYFASIAMLFIDIHLKTPDDRMMGYFEMPIFLIFFISIGRTLESYMKAKTGDAISALGKLKPSKALLVGDNDLSFSEAKTKTDSDYDHENSSSSETTRLLPNGNNVPARSSRGSIKETSLTLIEIGDTLLVQAGEVVPIDGLISSRGNYPFDMSSVTGESLPVTLHEGDEVMTGTTCLKAVFMKVTSTSSETLIDRIIRVVNDAQSKKAPIEKIADAVTAVFVPVIVLLSIITLIVWLVVAANAAELGGKMDQGGKIFFAIQFSVATLVVACPCGIGLATPTAIAVGSGVLANHGVLVQSGSESFELANKVQIVVLDKTGTLTEGKISIVSEERLSKKEDGLLDEDVLWGMVSSMEEQSSHPIAKAVKSHASAKSHSLLPDLSSYEEVSGRGVKGVFSCDDKMLEMRIGSGKFVGAGSQPSSTVDRWRNNGNSIVFVALKEAGADDEALTITYALAIADSPREESREVVQQLHNAGKQIFMLTGDEELTARAIARDVGIAEENVMAGAMPDDKVKYIEKLRNEANCKPLSPTMLSRMKRWIGKPDKREVTPLVMFVGDGLNDSGAIIAADVGTSQGSGSQITISSAHFILLNSSLRSLIKIFKLSKLVKTRIIINFIWAIVFNVTLVPVAAGVFYPLGVKLPPVYSALAMALSSVSVVISSLLLRLHRPSN
ncbi:hypothetical protein E3P78_04130 [Wallemia ichthyophaga]|nr:hypothetical protein E3P78_04130 [Wallemia ichthyophaga]